MIHTACGNPVEMTVIAYFAYLPQLLPLCHRGSPRCGPGALVLVWSVARSWVAASQVAVCWAAECCLAECSAALGSSLQGSTA